LRYARTLLRLSDHTMGVGVAVASIALGASVVEKQLTLARAEGGVDSAVSLEPAEMHSLVVETERAWRSLGRVTYRTTAADEKSKVFRRPPHIARDLRAGEVLDAGAVRAIRPGLGLPPKLLELALGSPDSRDVARSTPLSWDPLIAKSGAK
jgi:sialic acid synthase SpsE